MLAYLSFLAAVVSVQKLIRQSRRWGRSRDSRPPCIYELDGASERHKLAAVWTGCVRFQYCPGYTSAMTCPYGGTALVRTTPLVVRRCRV